MNLPLRLVHATDQHVNPRNGAPLGWAQALAAINRLDPAPDFLVCGGDCIGDALEKVDRAEVEQQWDLYDRVLAEHNRLPVRPVIGNHDVWAWSARTVDPSTAGYGKALALDRLGLKTGYYSFDAGGWHFVVLDNIQRKDFRYVASLDPAQAEWLAADLSASGGRPVCIFSHIPILSIAPFNFPGFLKDDFYRIPDSWVHYDVLPLLDLLNQHNVRLCISGHLHMVDRVDFRGISFICNGSICGHWWNGPYRKFAEGFGIFDLAHDGTFSHQYVPFGWDAARHQD